MDRRMDGTTKHISLLHILHEYCLPLVMATGYGSTGDSSVDDYKLGRLVRILEKELSSYCM